MVEIELDGKKVSVQEGSMVMHAAEAAGTYIPHFCYHKKLSIAANCRMCLVDVEKAPKPMPACATPVTQGMIVRTKSEKALKRFKAGKTAITIEVMSFLRDWLQHHIKESDKALGRHLGQGVGEVQFAAGIGVDVARLERDAPQRAFALAAQDLVVPGLAVFLLDFGAHHDHPALDGDVDVLLLHTGDLGQHRVGVAVFLDVDPDLAGRWQRLAVQGLDEETGRHVAEEVVEQAATGHQ